MKAIDAVANLRKLIKLLENHREAEILMVTATVWVSAKEPFLELAREFPHPFSKKYEEGEYGYLELEHGDLQKSAEISLRIRRSTVCELIEPARPARFHCPSIFSPEEEAELEQS